MPVSSTCPVAPTVAEFNGVIQRLHYEDRPGQFKAQITKSVESLFHVRLGRQESVTCMTELTDGTLSWYLGTRLALSTSRFR